MSLGDNGSRPGNAVVAGILEYSYGLMSCGCYTSGQSGLYHLHVGVFAIEVSHLIGTCICSLFKTRHNSYHTIPYHNSYHASITVV